MTKLYILAHVEDALVHSFLDALDALRRCHRNGMLFEAEVGNEASHLSVEEMARIMAISPDIKAIDLWRRRPATAMLMDSDD